MFNPEVFYSNACTELNINRLSTSERGDRERVGWPPGQEVREEGEERDVLRSVRYGSWTGGGTGVGWVGWMVGVLQMLSR